MSGPTGSLEIGYSGIQVEIEDEKIGIVIEVKYAQYAQQKAGQIQ